MSETTNTPENVPSMKNENESLADLIKWMFLGFLVAILIIAFVVSCDDNKMQERYLQTK